MQLLLKERLWEAESVVLEKLPLQHLSSLTQELLKREELNLYFQMSTNRLKSLHL